MKRVNDSETICNNYLTIWKYYVTICDNQKQAYDCERICCDIETICNHQNRFTIVKRIPNEFATILKRANDGERTY